MYSKLSFLCFALITSACFGEVLRPRRRGFYTIVAPQSIRWNVPFHVSVSVGEFHQSCSFNISIEDSFDGGTKVSKAVEVAPRSTRLVRMVVPPQRPFVQMTVIGYQGIISRDRVSLSVDEESYTVTIQTDKPKYRPGDLLQFRVICVNQLDRPALVGRHITVAINNGRGNRVGQFSSVRLVQGVFRGEFQISDNTVLGDWKIEVFVDASQEAVKKKVFQVAKYVLPGFSVEIVTKEDIGVSDGRLDMYIKARYAFGEPVKGNLSAAFQLRVLSVWGLKGFDKSIVLEEQIDGIANVSLDLARLGIHGGIEANKPRIIETIEVAVKVQNALTREEVAAETEIRVHNYPLKISLNAPKIFDGNFAKVEIFVTDLQGNPVQSLADEVVILGHCARCLMDSVSRMFEVRIRQIEDGPSTLGWVDLDENGYGAIDVDLSNFSGRNVALQAKYRNSYSQMELIERHIDNDLRLDVVTQRNKVGKELVVRVSGSAPLNDFVYDIVSQGNIQKSEHVIVPENETTYLLHINVTPTMTPKTVLYVHRTKAMFLESRLKEIYIEPMDRNFIDISADEEVKPGALVSINVTTKGGSYVGLMGLDEAAGGNHELRPELGKFQVRDSKYLRQPKDAQLRVLTNCQMKPDDGPKKDSYPWDDEVLITSRFDEPEEVEPRIRSKFSESWVFKDFERTTGKVLRLHETVPDSITSWALTGFSFDSDSGFVQSERVTHVKAFQQFFISIDLPELVKEDEIIEIPVYVFNYLDKGQETEVTIESNSKEVEFLDKPTKGFTAASNQTISKSISPQGKVKLMFFIRPRKSGRYNVTVRAISSAASDAVQKPLTVESKGVPHSFSKTYLVHFLQDGEQEDELQVDIPRTAVPGSESVQLSVVGDVFGPLVRCLYKLARVPYGNGEENMKNFVSNLLVLKYLKAFNHSNPSLESKTKLHLELGYQTQMVFSHLDGSFSLFDRTEERTGDLWVTAYVMWGLQQAGQHIKIDNLVILRGLNYLKRKQNEKGAITRGRGLEDDVNLTAFTLLAFIMGDNDQGHAVTMGLRFLFENLDDVEESACASIAKYALILGKHEKSGELLSSLKSHAGVTSGQVEWVHQETLKSSLETAAGMFMRLLESQSMPVETLFPVVRALIMSASTDKSPPMHLVALDAMISIGCEMNFGQKDLNIRYNIDQKQSGEFHVDSENSQLHQELEVNKTARKIKLKTSGRGFAIATIKYKYNIGSADQSATPFYSSNVTLREFSESIMVLEICLSVVSPETRSNLTVMDINLQSGYKVSKKTFDIVLDKNKQVKAIQLNGNGASVRTYIEGVEKSGTCIQLEAIKTFNVFDVKEISIVAYDAYREEHRSTSLYDIASMIRSELESTSSS